MAKEFHLPDVVGMLTPKPGVYKHKTHREVNLVPDIKDEMIKTLKLRNLIFFLCIVVAAASAGATLIFGTVMGGQQIALEGKQESIKKFSEKLNSYSDLDEFLTIKDQVDNLSTLTDNKQVLSRTFNILSALLPNGADTITISELNVNLDTEQPIFTFDAQANAGSDDIDYRVLDAFQKSMDYMRYDYGDYVDKNGATIPAYCIIDKDSSGAVLQDSNKSFYAYWTIKGEGCNPSDDTKVSEYSLEKYEGQDVVKIWRTPQFNDWYKKTEKDNQPYMGLNGEIKNVPHFDSKCITYSGDDSEDSSRPKWTTTVSDICQLISGGSSGINVTESSNGRDGNENLVLRFSATIAISPDAYKFTNYHLIALPLSGYHNVTDSYVQVQNMFSERAADCQPGDAACESTENSGGDTNNNGGNQNG